MNPELTEIVYAVPAPQSSTPITYTQPPMYVEQTPSPVSITRPTYVEQTPAVAINNDNINNLYINVQDYLDILNSLYDKTKDTFISVNTVLENMKPFIYKKTNNN